VRHTRGFTPGWYAVPRWGTPNIPPPQSPHRPQRQHHNTPVQRQLFFLMGDNQTIPIQGQDLKQTGGSGTGPERALERRHPDPPRATARKLSRPQRSLRVQDRSRGAPKNRSGAGSAEASIGSDQTLPLARSAKANPSPSLPASIGPVPRSPPFISARFTTTISLIPFSA
jgi:hypothetical protein